MKRSQYARGLSLAGALAVVGLLVLPSVSTAATAIVNLGGAKSFAVLAGSTVTNTGSTTIGGTAGGEVGLSPGTSVTGFPPGISGTQHVADANAGSAQVALTTAYNDAATRPPTASAVVPSDIGGLTFVAGVYAYSTSLGLTGTVTLDALGDPAAVFVFQAGSTLTTASSSTVLLVNGAQACNVFWQVGTSATLGTTSAFAGHILANASITATTGAVVHGSLLARTGAVTLDSNVITNDNCAAVVTPTPTVTATPSDTATVTPTPSATPSETPTVVATTPPTGELPNTSEPWYNIQALAMFLMLMGAAGLIIRRRTS